MRRLTCSLPLLLLSLGCPSSGKDTGTTADADTDTDTDTDADGDTDTDTDTDTEPTTDTALAFIVYEGHADLSAGSWVGYEAWVAYNVDSVEWCRTQNTYTATPVTESLCDGCEFAYDAPFDDGTLTGDGCDNIGMTADLFDGQEWIYGWAPSYTYTYGGNDYTYDNAWFFEYEGAWYWWAYGYTNEARDVIDYRGLGYSIYYYYY